LGFFVLIQLVKAVVYIIYSEILNKFYIGSCLDLKKRIIQHQNHEFNKAYTVKPDDWKLYYSIESLEYKQARDIEKHIKKMKSSKYIKN